MPSLHTDLGVQAASVDGRRQSRSAVSGALLVPWTRTSTVHRSFAVHGPRTWKRPPAALWSPELISTLKHQLKTHLFLVLVAAVGVVYRRPTPLWLFLASSAPTTNTRT